MYKNSFIADNGRRLPMFDGISDALDRVDVLMLQCGPTNAARYYRLRDAQTILLRLWREVNDNAHIP